MEPQNYDFTKVEYISQKCHGCEAHATALRTLTKKCLECQNKLDLGLSLMSPCTMSPTSQPFPCQPLTADPGRGGRDSTLAQVDPGGGMVGRSVDRQTFKI